MAILRATDLRLQGFLWPNGEFSFGRVKTTSTPVGGLPVEDLTLWPNGDASVEHALDRLEGRIEDSPASGLGLSNVPNSHRAEDYEGNQDPKRRGSKGLTRHGAKMIRSGAYLIESSSPKYTVSFATLTLPDMDARARGGVMVHWSQILRVFFQRLSRHLMRSGLPGEIAYVVEMHPQRGKDTGELWPHIHCLFQGKRFRYEGSWAISPKQLGDVWRDVVSGILPETGKYWKASHWNIQCVLKSCEGYIGKYLSKGYSRASMADNDFAIQWPIRSWYGCVGGLKEKIAKTKVLLGTETCLALQDEWKQRNKDILYYSDINIVLDNGAKLWLGAAGRMRGELENEVRELEGARMAELLSNPAW